MQIAGYEMMEAEIMVKESSLLSLVVVAVRDAANSNAAPAAVCPTASAESRRCLIPQATIGVVVRASPSFGVLVANVFVRDAVELMSLICRA